jgi:hypothetical protein
MRGFEIVFKKGTRFFTFKKAPIYGTRPFCSLAAAINAVVTVTKPTNGSALVQQHCLSGP